MSLKFPDMIRALVSFCEKIQDNILYMDVCALLHNSQLSSFLEQVYRYPEDVSPLCSNTTDVYLNNRPVAYGFTSAHKAIIFARRATVSSYDSTGSQQGADVAPCCATPTLVAALAASFACCFLSVLVFLCLRFIHLRRTWTPRHSAQPLQGEGQAQQQPKLGLDAATIALIPSFPYLRESSDWAPAECAVCLGALDEGETVRQLPACKHPALLLCLFGPLTSLKYPPSAGAIAHRLVAPFPTVVASHHPGHTSKPGTIHENLR
uniref:RING-type E3 ubiquitin transferase n=1 Tax=Triticum aestivum TaxID=4565 RepID=A0A077RUU8_WHEAT|nr:unnamed protein product [Triticum aestivum]